MMFVLRVVLVVGALSYFALMREGADPVADARRLAVLPSPAAVASALPPEAREKVVRDVLARGLMAELSRRAAEPEAPEASRDTLNEADRAPAWRGVERR